MFHIKGLLPSKYLMQVFKTLKNYYFLVWTESDRLSKLLMKKQNEDDGARPFQSNQTPS